MQNVFLGSFIFILSILLAPSAFSQNNPDVYLFNNSSGEVSLDSSRYEVKTRGDIPEPKVIVVKKKAAAPTPTPAPVPVAKQPDPDKASDSSDDEKQTKSNSKKRDWLEVDPRFNYVQVSLAPAFMYVDSQSSSWYRNYYSATPALTAQAEFWMRRKLGLKASYLSSTAGDITSSPTNDRKIEVNHREYELSFLYRKYSANHRMASSLIGGITYKEYEMSMTPTETNRVGIKTKGAGLYIASRIPQTPTHAYTISTTYRPSLKIEEGETTVSYSSGDIDASSAWEFAFKSEHIMNRHNIFHWGISHQFEKSVYSGSSTSNDPITGSTIEGVSVESGRTMIHLGVTWGD